MRESTMPTYTVSVTAPGNPYARTFEQMLDVLPAAAMEGSEETAMATLWFDVKAPNPDAAIERAYLRAHGMLTGADVEFRVVRSSTVPGRQPWWRRLLPA